MRGRPGATTLVLLLALLLAGGSDFFFGLLPARADSVGARMEFDYTGSDMESEDKTTGVLSEIKSDTWGQKYHLNVAKSIFPNIQFNGGGIFDRDVTNSTIDDVERESIMTNSRPFFDLTLRTPLYSAGAGFSKREEKTETQDLPGQSKVNEQYNAMFGWRPADLPSIEMRVEKINLYDKEHLLADTTTTSGFMNCNYSRNNLSLQYRPSFQKSSIRLDGVETKSMANNGRATYGNSFFNDRISFYTGLTVSRLHADTMANGSGLLSNPIFPFKGLFVLDDLLSQGTLPEAQALVDGNLVDDSGVNLGLPGIGDDRRSRNMGLDFGNDVEVNRLLLWVDRQLPSAIASSFSWEIYTSADNLNWRLHATVFPASFDAFQNFFDIDFPATTVRYVRVTVRPLAISVPGATDFPNIVVTELQAFIRKPATALAGSSSASSQVYNMDVRSRLWDGHELYHEFSYFLATSDPGSQRRMTLSNAMAASRRFSPIFSGSMRLAREELEEKLKSGQANVYNVSLRADPLRTLNHSLLFSGRRELMESESMDRDAVFLQNWAELYPGLDIYLHSGLIDQRQGNGEKDTSTVINYGATMTPHRTMTVTLSGSDNSTRMSGGERPEATKKDKRWDVGASFRPFETVYLVAAVGSLTQENRRDTLKNFAVNWSPFPYGTLRFGFAYNQEFHTEDESVLTTIQPSMRWEISRRILLDVSCAFLETDSILRMMDATTYNVRMQFIY